MVLLRDLDPGEEITCDYKYSLEKDPPEWYRRCLERHLVRMGIKEGKIKSIMDDIRHSKVQQSRS